MLNHVLSVEYGTLNVHTVDYSYRSVPLAVTQFSLRAETCHIPLFVKSPAVCFRYFCYTHILCIQVTQEQIYKDAIKVNCLIYITSCISSTAIKQKSHV